MKPPSEIEKESLEAHVELCAIRYNNLETKIDNLEHRLDKLELHMVDIKNSLASKVEGQNKQTINIFTSVIGILAAGLIGFITSGIFK
jgi:predicted  nucleic acid-binding Zn-ribbon protein